MKKIKVIVLFFVSAFLLNFTVIATDLPAEFSKYKIEEVDGLFQGKTADKIWTLSYGADESQVTIVKLKSKNGVNYIVCTDYFEVNYFLNKNGFGVRELKNSWCKVPKEISSAVINKEEMKKQQVITPNKVNDEKALGLIASYLPELLNQNYTHLLN